MVCQRRQMTIYKETGKSSRKEYININIIRLLMNILPHQYGQFKDKSYWQKFFSSLKQTKDEFFEWYGQFSDYKDILRHLSPKGRIFHVGCGKSTFTQDLLQQYPQLLITNCDYSEAVIKDMRVRSQKLKIQMDYVVCDLLQPLSEQYAQVFDYVMDKGTLDAMLPQNTAQHVSAIKQAYFPNVENSLKEGGTFLVISLLQPFVLQTILEYFSEHSISVYECLLPKSKLQPFLLTIRKAHPSLSLIPLSKGQSLPIGNAQQLKEKIASLQAGVEFNARLKKIIPGFQTRYDIFSKDKTLRYAIEIIDSDDRAVCEQNTCSVYIVPHGQENLPLYQGHLLNDLAAQIKTSRVLIVKMVSGFSGSMNQLKEELNTVLPDLIQASCNPNKVPYLTDGDDLGYRNYIYEDKDIIVEEVLVQNQPYRKMFLKTSPTIPLLESRLTYYSCNNPLFEKVRDIKSEVLPFKKGFFTGIDKDELVHQNSRILYSIVCGFFAQKKLKKEMKILVLGNQFLFAKFLSQCFPQSIVTLVTENKNLLKVGQKFFDVSEKDNFSIIILNPVEFVIKHDANEKYNCIISTTHSDAKRILQFSKLLEPDGLLIHKSEGVKVNDRLKEIFFPIYGIEGNSIRFNICLQYPKKYHEEKDLIIHKQQIDVKSKATKPNEWELDWFKKIQILYPIIQATTFIEEKQPFLDMFEEVEEPKKKKKGKKK